MKQMYNMLFLCVVLSFCVLIQVILSNEFS